MFVPKSTDGTEAQEIVPFAILVHVTHMHIDGHNTMTTMQNTQVWQATVHKVDWTRTLKIVFNV